MWPVRKGRRPGLDQNTSDSVMQHNLSYRNDGAGHLLYTSLDNGAQTHHVVRFNISSRTRS